MLKNNEKVKKFDMKMTNSVPSQNYQTGDPICTNLTRLFCRIYLLLC